MSSRLNINQSISIPSSFMQMTIKKLNPSHMSNSDFSDLGSFEFPNFCDVFTKINGQCYDQTLIVQVKKILTCMLQFCLKKIKNLMIFKD
jgi:hypothetical protein